MVGALLLTIGLSLFVLFRLRLANGNRNGRKARR
jgi:hypothetical protein